MDNKITKSRLKTFFTYDLFKVVAIAVALCLVFNFIFNLFTTRPNAGQSLNIIYGDDLDVSEKGALLFLEPFDEKATYRYSYETLEVADKYLQAGNSTSQNMIKTWHEAGDDDLFICTDSLTDNENPNSSLYYYYVSQLYAEDLTKYVAKAIEFVESNEFYVNGVLNEQKIIEYFNEKNFKDNRFKTKEQKQQGRNLEIERITTIYNSAKTLQKVFNEHPEILKEETFEWYGISTTGKYALRLKGLTGSAENVALNDFKGVKLEDVNGVNTFTGEVYLMVGAHAEVNGDNHYESLVYLVSMIKKYSNFIS